MKARSRTILVRSTQVIALVTLGMIAIALILALQMQPRVPVTQPLDELQIASIEQLLLDAAPSNVRDTQLQELSVTDAQLNLLLRYASELFETERVLTARVDLPGEAIVAELSVPLFTGVASPYVNVSGEFSSDGSELNLESLKMGRLKIPGALVNGLARSIEKRYLRQSRSYVEVLAVLDSVRQIEISPHKLDVDLLWEPALISRIRSQAQRLLVSAADRARIERHYRSLTLIVDSIPDSTRAITLTTLLRPLFADAALQSRQHSQAIAENRTLLLTVAAYVNQEDIGQWLDLDVAERLPRARIIEVRIQRRQDLAQHVASSAAIAASAGVGVAQVLSSIKENYDARYRSGFSFSDLTANTAGMTIGRLATESENRAMVVQDRMSRLQDDAEYLPGLDSSRDGLSEADFNALYRSAGSSEYQARLNEIEAVVMQLPLFADVLK